MGTTRIDFDRLRQVREELQRLSRARTDFGYYLNELSLGFIPSVTLNIFIMIDSSSSTVAYINTLNATQKYIAIFLNYWFKAFQPNSVSSVIVFFCISIGMSIVVGLTKYGSNLIWSDRILGRLKYRFEQSQVISKFIDGWESLPDISLYTPNLWRKAYLWPTGTNDRPSPIQIQVRTLVNNIDWYSLPPIRLFRWQWILYMLRIVGVVVCLAAQGGFLLMMPGYQEPPSQLWIACLAVMLGSYLLFILTCFIGAIVPDIPLSKRARLVMNKLQPVFDVLGPDKYW